MTLDDLKSRVTSYFTNNNLHENEVSRRNTIASWATLAPYAARHFASDFVAPNFDNKDAIGVDSPMARRLIAESGKDIGVLPQRTLPKMGDNAVYMPKPNWLLRQQFTFSPEELASWKPHGMLAPVNTEQILPEVLAHEVGHGMAHYGEGLQRLAARGRIPMMAGGALASTVDLIRGVIGDKSDEERDRLLNRSSIESGVGMAPTLMNEYHASSNAMKLLHELPTQEAEPILARAARNLPRAWSTYGLLGLAGMLAPQAARWYYHHSPLKT